jgi:hypothetical protein
MKRLLFSLFGFVACAASAWAGPLDSLFAEPNLWEMKQADFMTAAGKLGYEWTSKTQDSARVAMDSRMIRRAASSSSSTSQDSTMGSEARLTLFGLPIVESVAHFDEGKLKEVTVVYYSRGDVGDLPKDKYTVFLYAARDALTKAANVPFTVRGKDATNAVKADGFLWQTPATRYLLEYSFTKGLKPQDPPFRAEFIRLSAAPPTKTVSLLASATNTDRAKFSGLMHVKRDATSGDVWLGDVPMVDQGQKGYCVVATAERVMRYYGSKVDENELAQVANTRTEGGTSTDSMLEGLKKLGARLKVRVREVEHWDVHEFLKLMADYNREAKHEHASELRDPGHMIDVGAVYAEMDANILRETRTKNKSEINRFQREVQRRVDDGVPLLWTVMLGKVPEKGIPQNAGGHMRLIIGYNLPKNEILYSDSWGAGHELKRMSTEDAWTMTTGAMVIEPL